MSLDVGYVESLCRRHAPRVARFREVVRQVRVERQRSCARCGIDVRVREYEGVIGRQSTVSTFHASLHIRAMGLAIHVQRSDGDGDEDGEAHEGDHGRIGNESCKLLKRTYFALAGVAVAIDQVERLELERAVR